MKDLKRAGQDEWKIVAIPTPAVAATHRTIGGDLVEGPRPIQLKLNGKSFYVVGFSASDYPTDRYTINYAWAPAVTGPYEVARTTDQLDFLDLGVAIKAKYQLSWMGRPAFYMNSHHELHMLFHAVEKKLHPGHNFSMWPSDDVISTFFRAVFDVRVSAQLDASGKLSIALMPE